MRNRTTDRLRELAPAARGSQGAGSGNLLSVFYLMSLPLADPLLQFMEKLSSEGGTGKRENSATGK